MASSSPVPPAQGRQPSRFAGLLFKGLARLLRDAAAALAFAAAAALVWQNRTLRCWEAQAVRVTALRFLGLRTWIPFHEHDVLLFPNPAGVPVGIQITAACTSAVFLLPLAATVGVLLCLRRLSAARVLIAAAITAALMCAVDLARLLGLVAALAYGGTRAFSWMHVEVGTWLSMLSAIGGFVIFCRLLVGRWWPGGAGSVAAGPVAADPVAKSMAVNT